MKGISQLVSMVLVIAFGIAAMAIVLTVVNPLLDRAKDSALVNEGTQNMLLIDSVIKAVASEAQGSKRTINIKITDGTLRTNATTSWVYLDYTPRTNYEIDGFSGDVRIISRPWFLEFFSKYVDGDSANDVWTRYNGTWAVDSARLKGDGGIAYNNFGNLSAFTYTGTVAPSIAPEGQIFILPGSSRDLILFFPFDENVNTTTTIAYDFSGYGNNGTLRNGTGQTCFTSGACPDWVSGIFGNGTFYDGKGDFINTTASTSLNIGSNVTVAAWINPSKIASSYIAGKGAGSGTQAYTIQMTSGGNIQFTTNTSTGVTSATALSTGNWYYLVGTYNTTHLVIYINGVQDATQAWTSASTNSLAFVVGGNTTGSSIFNGTIDEVMVFNRSLTASEVSYLYETSTKKVTAGGHETQTISTPGNATIVLAAPGESYFTDIKVKYGQPNIRFIVPYNRIDIENQLRIGSGDHTLVIKNDGINATNNKPLILISGT